MTKKLSKSQLKKVRHIIESKVYQGSLSFTKKEGLTPKDKRFNKYARQLLKRGFDDSETWDLGLGYSYGRMADPKVKKV